MEIVSCANFLSQNCGFGRGLGSVCSFTVLMNILILFFVFVLGLRLLQIDRIYEGILGTCVECTRRSMDFGHGFYTNGVSDSMFLSCERSAIHTVLDRTNRMHVQCSDKLDQDEDMFSEGKENCDPKQARHHGHYSNCSITSELSEEEIKSQERNLDEQKNGQKGLLDIAKELEEERNASASAIEEAMAMLMRVQMEKGSIEMRAREYRGISEQKQLYDYQMIRSLRKIVSELESERRLLEWRLDFYKKNSIMDCQCGKMPRRFSNVPIELKSNEQLHSLKEIQKNYKIEDEKTDGFLSSLELDSST